MLTTLLTFAILHWVALISPGPNMILVSQLAASGYRASACIACVGVSVVAVIWALLAILGLNALFAAHAQLRLAVQIAGGLYLCYVAFRLWRAGAVSGSRPPGFAAPWAAFRLGFMTNITNPKTALFFGSVFVTALPEQFDAPLLAAVVALVFINALTWHTVLALALSHPRIQAGYERQRQRLNRAAGVIVGAYGARLLLTTAEELRSR